MVSLLLYTVYCIISTIDNYLICLSHLWFTSRCIVLSLYFPPLWSLFFLSVFTRFHHDNPLVPLLLVIHIRCAPLLDSIFLLLPSSPHYSTVIHTGLLSTTTPDLCTAIPGSLGLRVVVWLTELTTSFAYRRERSVRYRRRPWISASDLRWPSASDTWWPRSNWRGRWPAVPDGWWRWPSRSLPPVFFRRGSSCQPTTGWSFPDFFLRGWPAWWRLSTTSGWRWPLSRCPFHFPGWWGGLSLGDTGVWALTVTLLRFLGRGPLWFGGHLLSSPFRLLLNVSLLVST